MSDKEYRKRLEEWAAQRQDLEAQKKSTQGYVPSRMKVRAPLGCVVAIAALLLALAYFVAAHAAEWKRWLF